MYFQKAVKTPFLRTFFASVFIANLVAVVPGFAQDSSSDVQLLKHQVDQVSQELNIAQKALATVQRTRKSTLYVMIPLTAVVGTLSVLALIKGDPQGLKSLFFKQPATATSLAKFGKFMGASSGFVGAQEIYYLTFKNPEQLKEARTRVIFLNNQLTKLRHSLDVLEETP